MSRLWLVTGTRGAGKTTFCQGIAQQWHADGRDVAGVLSPPVFEGNVKIGIDVIHLRSGERRRLADLRPPQDTAIEQLVTRRWRFDPAVLTWGDQVLAQAVPCDLLVVDELGTLEFERNQGWLNGLFALDSAAYELALVVIRPELLDAALARWPWGIVKKI